MFERAFVATLDSRLRGNDEDIIDHSLKPSSPRRRGSRASDRLLPVLILACVSTAAAAQTVAPTVEDGLMVGAIDPSVSPCQDFYAHACNGWLKANPIPPDQTSWD